MRLVHNGEETEGRGEILMEIVATMLLPVKRLMDPECNPGTCANTPNNSAWA